MHKPFWLMYGPKRYYKFRRQTFVNWLDVHTHMAFEEYKTSQEAVCGYCNRSGDELWWYLPTCRAHSWDIKNYMSRMRGDAKPNPYRRK